MIALLSHEVYVNPFRNPISSIHQWTALKGIETGSNQVFAKKGCKHVNPLLKPVSDNQQWRALIVRDTKPLKPDRSRLILSKSYLNVKSQSTVCLTSSTC